MSTPLPNVPPFEELLAGTHVVSLPMRVRFRGIMERESLLLRGPAGWGEFCPFPSTATPRPPRGSPPPLKPAGTGSPLRCGP